MALYSLNALPVTSGSVKKQIKTRRSIGKCSSITILAMRRVLSDRLSESCAASWQAVPPRMLRKATRCTARIASARQAAIYFAHIVFAANLTRAGGIFGRDRTTARHACFKMEDWRDDVRIDRAFDALEPALKCWLEAFSASDMASGETESGELFAGEFE